MAKNIPIFLEGAREPIGLAEYDSETGKLTATIQPKYKTVVQPRIHNFVIRKDTDRNGS